MTEGSPCDRCTYATRHVIDQGTRRACRHPVVPGLEGAGFALVARARGAQLADDVGVVLNRDIAGAQHVPTWPTNYEPSMVDSCQGFAAQLEETQDENQEPEAGSVHTGEGADACL